MQMHVDGEPLPAVRPPRVDSTPPPATTPAGDDAPPRELVDYALAQLALHWTAADVVLLTSAMVGVYVGLFRADVGALALKLCVRVNAAGVPWSGRVVLNAPRLLDLVEIDAPEALALVTPRDLREARLASMARAPRSPLLAPRYPGMPTLNRADTVPGDVLLRAVETLADDEDDPLALWWTDRSLHVEGPGFRVILRAQPAAESEPVEDQWFEAAAIEDVLRARLARRGDRL